MNSSDSAPPPPPPAEPIDIIDEVLGIQQITVKKPDGTKQLVRRELPLSPEEEALRKQYQDIVTEQVGIIEQLSSPALAINIPEFKPVLDEYRRQRGLEIKRTFEDVTRTQEESLARRGIADSTAATEVRAARDVAQQTALDQADRNTSLVAEQLRSDAIGRAGGLLNLAFSRQDKQTADMAQGLALANQSQQSILSADVANNQLQFQSSLAAYQANQSQKAANLNAFATLGGAALGAGLKEGGLFTKAFGF